MKVLFVYSGNSKFFEISPFIKSQAESLTRKGIEVLYFPIKGKGIKGYRQNVKPLKAFISKHQPDIIHAHYSLTGWVAYLAAKRIPKVLSLMGSDTDFYSGKDLKKSISMWFTRIQVTLIQLNFNAFIVKSKNLERSVWRKKKAYVIPNGVNYHKFKPLDKAACRESLKLSEDKKILLFMGELENARKNFMLVEKALPHLKTKNVEVVTPFPVKHEQVPLFLNACDVLVFPSHKEGSPNVIKEAIACNTKIVATPSGDIVERTQNLKSVLISDFSEQELAKKIDQSLADTTKVNSRDLVRNEIDEDLTADQIISIYNSILK